jgi:hypothetical protein
VLCLAGALRRRDWRSRCDSGLNRHGATIIPLGPGSLRDSSSLPEGQSTAFLRTRHIRAGPALPSYLALLHAGFSVPRVSPLGRWALTPPFHPCQMRPTESGQPGGFAAGLPQRYESHRRFIFCGTFRGRVFAFRLRETRGATPWCYQARRPSPWKLPKAVSRVFGVRTFLPPTLLPHCGGSRQAGDHPTHPPGQLYGMSASRAVKSKKLKSGSR